MRHSLLLLGIFLCIATTAWSETETDQLLENRLKAHIEFLADDLMLGRQPGTAGYNIAANYVASQFRQMGLMPAGTGGSYFQQVPLREAFLEPGSAELSLLHHDQLTSLKFVDDFFMSPSLQRTTSQIDAEMVFVGYGIDSPELDHRDYENIDARGKVVVMLAGQPHDFPSEEGAHFASSMERKKAAVRHGAVGILTIHTPRMAERFKWERIKSRVGMPSMKWINENGDAYGTFKQLHGGAYVSHKAAGILFEGVSTDLQTLLEFDENAQPLPRFNLQGRVKMSKRSTHETIYSPNVAAVLPGSDPLLATEHVAYIGHLDHVGELHPSAVEEGQSDRINNGALDNASGISVMLETARMLAEGEAPRRSVLFVAVTAEEKGLVGAEYFAIHPTVPIEDIVSVVNLDMPILLYDFADVIAFGAEHSSLAANVLSAAQSYGVELSPDPFPEQNIFIRSDHYRFVQQGVPSVYLKTGLTSTDENVDAASISDGFRQDHYHKPSDDLNLPIHYDAAAKFVKINAKIGELIANDPIRPSWHEGDFFGETFAK
jgi:hypothetical protein